MLWDILIPMLPNEVILLIQGTEPVTSHPELTIEKSAVWIKKMYKKERAWTRI